jgi:hypothetical protein
LVDRNIISMRQKRMCPSDIPMIVVIHPLLQYNILNATIFYTKCTAKSCTTAAALVIRISPCVQLHSNRLISNSAFIHSFFTSFLTSLNCHTSYHS